MGMPAHRGIYYIPCLHTPAPAPMSSPCYPAILGTGVISTVITMNVLWAVSVNNMPVFILPLQVAC